MFHNEEVWGTVVSFHFPEQGVTQASIDALLAQSIAFVHEIDRQFSTYKESSEVSQIRRGELDISDATDRMRLIWNLCAEACALTDGAFDPFQERLDGFDPSGYVKGWAADRLAEMAIDAGFWRDLFVTLGEEKGASAWSMTIYVKPFVRWVWLGAIFMCLGGIVAAGDKRYRRALDKQAAQKRTASIEPLEPAEGVS